MTEQTTRKNPLLAVPLLMAVGIGAAIYLVMVKLRVENEVAYSSACNFGQKFNCDAVQKSSYSLLLGIPVAIWAIPTYMMVALLGWLGMKNDPAVDGEDAPARAVSATNLLVLLGTLSVPYTIYLAYIQQTEIKAFCPNCLLMYACQIGVLIAAVIATPMKFVDALKDGLNTALAGRGAVALCAATFGVVLAASLIWYYGARDRAYHDGATSALNQVAQHIAAKKYDEAIDLLGGLTKRQDQYRIQADALMKQAVDAKFGFAEPSAGASTPVAVPPATAQPAAAAQAGGQPVAQPAAQPAARPVAQPVAQPVIQGPKPASNLSMADAAAQMRCSGEKSDLGFPVCEIPLSTEDFIEGNPDAKVTIIEFADFECGFCKMLSSNLKQTREKWKDQVRFVFKFYPMDDCNPRMGGEKMHPEGCLTAKASYCAGKQGKFWPAHDKLFSTQKSNQADKVPGYMKEIGVELGAWDACMKSDAPQQRILADVRMAARAGIHGTPRMYINGRLISGASSQSILDYVIKKALENPQAMVQASAGGQARPPQAGDAPMVAVKTAGGSTFIDRFEATIDKDGKAVSLAGVQPAQASWYQAKDACEAAGKRLCSEEEWASACTGQPAVDNNKNGWFNDDDIEGTRYPYGLFHAGGTCHDGQKTLDGDPIKTGSMHKCVTGAGVYDLVGNVGEWIEGDEKRASIVGGNFGSGEGAACNQRGTMFGPGIRNNTTGFRCCADTAVANATNDPADIPAARAGLIGAEMPKISVTDTQGNAINASTWKGKVTYLTFFASWCGSCKRELPELKNWVKELGPKGFQVVAVGVDRATSSSENFIKQHVPEPNSPVVLDPDAKSMTEFDISAMPTSFVIDKKGVVRKMIVGFAQDEVPAMKNFIRELL